MPPADILFIDDSQAEIPRTGVNPKKVSRYCVTVGVAVRWAECVALKELLDAYRRRIFRSDRMPPELKGSYLADERRRAPVMLHEACRQLSDLIDGRTRGMWVMVADRTAFAGMEGNATKLAHDTAMQFLFERVSGNPSFRESAPRSWVVVADHATSREVALLTRFLSEFSNPFTGGTLPEWIDPHALAGASEDWAGIQIADVTAYLAAHFRAKEMGVGGDEVAASAFRTMFWDKLAKKAGVRVRGIGYKTW